jgi:hypothetical protein
MDQRLTRGKRWLALGGASLALHLFACGDPALPDGGGADPTPARGGAGGAPPAGQSRIHRDGPHYSIVARHSPAGETLDELAAAAGFQVEVGDGASGWRETPVTLDLRGAPLPTAIHAVLAEVPHHLHYEWEAESGPGGPPWPDAPVALARVTVGALYRPPPWRRGRPRNTGLTQREDLARDPGDGLAARSPDVRARAVARIDPTSQGLEQLAAVLNDDPSPAVRIAAVRALAGGRGLHTHPHLISALEDPEPAVVVAAIEALEDAFDDHPVPEIRDRVADLTQHRDARIRAAARDFVDWVEE